MLLTLVLTVAGCGDRTGLTGGGVPPADLATADLAAVADLATGDLSRAADLLSPPDLASLPDLVVPRGAAMGIFRGPGWVLDTNHSRAFEQLDAQFDFGLARDIPVAGDFGKLKGSQVGVVRAANGSLSWSLDSNGNRAFDNGDAVYSFGSANAIPVVGDWTGDGRAKIGTFMGGSWVLDKNANGIYEANIDIACNFGQMGDIPVVGDWNGDGTADVGVFRQGSFVLDTNGSCSFDNGDATFMFGQPGDRPLVADWNGDGTSDVAVTRSNGAGALSWSLDSNGNHAFDGNDEVVLFGRDTDLAVAGAW